MPFSFHISNLMRFYVYRSTHVCLFFIIYNGFVTQENLLNPTKCQNRQVIKRKNTFISLKQQHFPKYTLFIRDFFLTYFIHFFSCIKRNQSIAEY